MYNAPVYTIGNYRLKHQICQVQFHQLIHISRCPQRQPKWTWSISRKRALPRACKPQLAGCGNSSRFKTKGFTFRGMARWLYIHFQCINKCVGMYDGSGDSVLQWFGWCLKNKMQPTNPNAVTWNTFVKQVNWTFLCMFPLLPYQCTVDCGMWKRVECKVWSVKCGV